ncbi:hypothetical protein [Nonomuraea fuscirosea]|uniref:hypothetical protein n=1 Tax=Nonomuraea fuscirosea TaxID=1291556 RepID=UPI003416AEE3
MVKVEEIDLDVQDLRARVSLQAEVLNPLRLSVGADVVAARLTDPPPGLRPDAPSRPAPEPRPQPPDER